MKIGLMSDSHDNLNNIRKALSVFSKEKVEYVIHAGDLISPFCLDLFKEYKKKFYLCSGNNKGDTKLIAEKMKNMGFFFDNVGEFIIDQKKFALYHGTEEKILYSLIKSEKQFDFIIYGHTHKKDLRKEGNTLIINPGEVYDLYGSPSVAILDTETGDVRFYNL